MLTITLAKSEFGRSDPPRRRGQRRLKEATMKQTKPLLARIPSESEGWLALRDCDVRCGAAQELRLFKV